MTPEPVLSVTESDLETAVAEARAAAAAAPASASAYERLGSLLVLAARYDDAAKALGLAIALDPKSPEALNNFGAVLRAVHKPDEAQRYFELALDANAGYHEALLNALGWYYEHQKYEDALRRLHAAVDAGNRRAETYERLAQTFFHLGRTEQTIDACQKALAVDPARADAWAILSNALVEHGDLSGARASIEKAIALNPRCAEYYRFLTATDTEDASAYAEPLRQLTADASLSPENRAQAYFARADIAAAQHEYAEAFEHYVEGNRISRQQFTYDEAGALQRLEDIATVFTRETIATGTLGYHATDRPVFIFGMPRSGTTLVEQIIASHPDVYAGGELTYLDDIANQVFAMPGPVTAETGERYHDAISRIAPSLAMRVTDKMPANFRYAGLIPMVMPHARMIHVQRDPVDTCWSCFTAFFTEGIAYAWDLGELGRYYRAYAKLMEHWRGALPDGAMLEVRYENLVGDFENEARRIIAYCGLEWDARCLRFYETQRAIRTASAAQVRKPLYSGSIGRAHPYGDFLRPLTDALG